MNYAIKGYRVMAQLTQAEMANALGLSLKTYRNKEKGITDFTGLELAGIRDVLNMRNIKVSGRDISIDDLILA